MLITSISISNSKGIPVSGAVFESSQEFDARVNYFWLNIGDLVFELPYNGYKDEYKNSTIKVKKEDGTSLTFRS